MKAALAAALAIVVAGCGGSGADKAGGKSEGKPVVLTLATYDERDPVEFAAAVERLSGGSIRVDVKAIGYGDPDYERHTVEDVRRGQVQLGLIGARVWDTMGVTSFRALLAPFLVDNLTLEGRVLESPLAARMLEGVERAGLVGVALLPGELRVPWGISRPLNHPQDYEGARFGIGPGGVAQATLHALGATVESFVPGGVPGLDGVEFDQWVVAFAAHHRQAGTLATNVVLWPRPQTIVMNQSAFRALSARQQQILRRAGREALEPALARIVREEERLLELICQRRKPSLVSASAGDLWALREAVQPVYEELERDVQTKRFIAAIRDLRGRVSEAAGPARCTGPAVPAQPTQASRLEGRWRVTWTRKDLLDAGLSVQGLPRKWIATVVYEFANGRFEGNSGETGTYETDVDVIRLVFETGRFVQLGEVYALGWSVYRDSLTFSHVPGSEPLQAFTIRPWTRVR